MGVSHRTFLGAVAGGLVIAPLDAGCTTAPAGSDAAAPALALPALSALAKEAYIDTFPLYVMYRTRYDALERSGAPKSLSARTRAGHPCLAGSHRTE